VAATPVAEAEVEAITASHAVRTQVLFLPSYGPVRLRPLRANFSARNILVVGQFEFHRS
jgi:hypothetical protein